MKLKFNKKGDEWLYKHGYDQFGKKVKIKLKPKKLTPHQKIRKENKRIIKKNRDLISERKESDLSDPELLIASFLGRERVYFIREKVFPGLYNPNTKKPLFFDFYLPNYNLAIEYDGLHHFKDNDPDRLRRQKAKDKVKDEFCSKKKIFLLRIPYWKQNRIEYLILERIDEITL